MKKIFELKNERAGLLKQANNALNEKDMVEFGAVKGKIQALNEQIEALELLDQETERFGGIENIVGVTGEPINRNDNEYKNAFFYAITNGITPKNGVGNEKVAILYNALSEGGGTPVGSEGGFLVPTSFNNKIIELRRQLVSLADLFSVEEVSSPTGWRAVDTAPTSGMESVDENVTIGTDDKPAFTKVTYSLTKYGLRVPVSNELMEDNTAGLEDYLVRWFAKKGIITENKLLIEALDTLTSKNLTVGSEIKALKSVLNKDLDPDVALNATVIVNQSAFDALDQMEDKNGKPLLQPDPTSGTPMMFKSHPVKVLSDAMLPNRNVTTAGETKGDYYPVYVGDFKQFATLFRGKKLEVASTTVGGDAWIKDQTEMRGIARMDVEKMDATAAVKREIFVAVP